MKTSIRILLALSLTLQFACAPNLAAVPTVRNTDKPATSRLTDFSSHPSESLTKANDFFNHLPQYLPSPYETQPNAPIRLQHQYIIGSATRPVMLESKSQPKQTDTTEESNAKAPPSNNKTNTKQPASKKEASSSATQSTESNATVQPGRVTYSTPPLDNAQAEKQMQNMIDRNWTAWTGSSNGVLTEQDIDALMINPELTGSQAALMGCLAQMLGNSLGSMTGLTKAQVLLLAADEPVATPQGSMGGLQQRYRVMFHNTNEDINRNGTYKLYPTSGKLTISGIRQGHIGDCWWLSSVEAMALADPNAIKSMIVQTGPDTFTVTFPGQTGIDVVLTQGEMDQLNIDHGHGVWLDVLTLAMAQDRDASQSTLSPFWKGTPGGGIQEGNSQTVGMSTLTGKNYQSIPLRTASTPPSAKAVGEDVRNALHTKPPTPVGICASTSNSGHALTVVGWLPAPAPGGSLIIHNPWGDTGKYTIEGTDHTVHMVDGYFVMPVSEAIGLFSSLTVPAPEGGSPTPQRASDSKVNSPTPQRASDSKVDSLTPQRVSDSKVDSQTPQRASDSKVDSLTPQRASAQQSESPPSHRLTEPVARLLPAAEPLDDTYSALQMRPGSMLVYRNNPIAVQTKNGAIAIAKDAAVFIVQVGDDVAIYNLSGSEPEGVSIFNGSEKVAVPMGKVMVLSPTNTSLSASPLAKIAPCYNEKALPAENGANAFQADFDYVSALQNCPQLHQFLKSSDPSQKRVADILLKVAAATKLSS